MELGTITEVVLLSFALADRINILRREKEASQAEALAAIQAKEKFQREQNVVLESRVIERTTDLEQTNEELKVTLENLKNTQSQLVDAEKMASLGQLTAGIAHEINNPINFVASNVKPLKRDIEDIVTFLDKYNELKDANGSLEEKLAEVEELKEELDVDFLVDEMNLLLKGIDEGAIRTAEIVKGLRNFSRLDEDDSKKADINVGINSTLVLLNNAIQKEEVKLVKNFAELEEIECFPGKLNQLFMNIMNNAIQALEGNPQNGKEKELTVSTFEQDEHVIVSIKDNGSGMDEETKNRIFEPFFTTKDVGKGTGLGLSIVYRIIESHNGSISVNSEIGKGTEFLIKIPMSRT